MDQFSWSNLDPVNGRWFKPPPGYLNLNVDGSFRDGIGTYYMEEFFVMIKVYGYGGSPENAMPMILYMRS